MKNLIPLSATTRHSVLVQLITAYNQFDAEASEIEQIFLLQKISVHAQRSPQINSKKTCLTT
jgi:hypothetical protein